MYARRAVLTRLPRTRIVRLARVAVVTEYARAHVSAFGRIRARRAVSARCTRARVVTLAVHAVIAARTVTLVTHARQVYARGTVTTRLVDARVEAGAACVVPAGVADTLVVAITASNALTVEARRLEATEVDTFTKLAKVTLKQEKKRKSKMYSNQT